MISETQPNILLFGAGGVGGFYLYLLSKVANVTVVCRSNYAVVKEQGFIINSSIFGQGIHFKPRVVRDCQEAATITEKGQPFDYIIVCSKAIPGVIPDAIKSAITLGHTAIVLIQNGVGIEEEYVTAFPTNPIVSCVVYLPVVQRPMGVIKQGEIERLEMGNYPASSKSMAAASFAELVRASGGTAELYPDVQVKRWYKLLINASWNPICALTRCFDVDYMESSSMATDLVRAVMEEVVAVAAACGHNITQEEVDAQIGLSMARIPKRAGIEPSMLQDVREGRRIEVEAILGNIVRIAKERGVRCEKIGMLYVLAKALDSELGRA